MTDTTRRPHARIPVGVFGASGTSGTELVTLLAAHPAVELSFATSRAHAGSTLDEIDPAATPIPLVHPDDADVRSAAAVFLAVPHGTAGDLAARCVEHARVVDLSGDHRLKDPRSHEAVYGSPRSDSVARDAVYGLTEYVRPALAGATVVANPGCFATLSEIALGPLAAEGLAEDHPVIDAKSGVSGAGRVPTARTHFCAVSEDLSAYKHGRSHRHVAEIEQFLDGVGRRSHRIVFTPHLAPIERGIQSTIVVRTPDGDAGRVRAVLFERYRHEPFIQVLPPGREARIRAVARTNQVQLSVHDVEGTDHVVITGALDNLTKGAAGQAIQNFNVMWGMPETTGLALPTAAA